MVTDFLAFCGLVILMILSVFGFLGYAVGKERNQGGLGFVLGFLLGPIGILTAALLPQKHLPSTELRIAPRTPPSRQGVVDQTEDWLNSLDEPKRKLR